MTPRELARQLLSSRKAQPIVPVKLTPVPMNAEAVKRMFDALPPRETVAEFDSQLNSGDIWFLRTMRISVSS